MINIYDNQNVVGIKYAESKISSKKKNPSTKMKKSAINTEQPGMAQIPLVSCQCMLLLFFFFISFIIS